MSQTQIKISIEDSQSSFTNLTPDLACHIWCETSFFMHYFTLKSQHIVFIWNPCAMTVMWHVDEWPRCLMFESNVVWYLNAQLSVDQPQQNRLISLRNERALGWTWVAQSQENAWVQGLFQDLISAAEEHDFNERYFTNCHYRGTHYHTGYQSHVEHSHTSLLWGWGLQQTSIRQCERSTGRGNMLMMKTKPVLCFHHSLFASSISFWSFTFQMVQFRY